MNEWKEYKLGEITKTNLKSIDKTYNHIVIQYLDTGSITQGKIEGYQIFNLSDAPSRARRLVKEGDIIYSSVRPIQRHYGIIKNPSPNLVVSTGFVVITCNQQLASSQYIYYFLKNDEMVNYLDMVAEASTSTYLSLKPSDIEEVDILLPPLPEQRAIASILSSLDDKIDLLHRQNATLEALAETLFRQWFVEEAEESWDETNLYNVIELVGGGTPKTDVEDFWSGEIKWISGKDVTPNHKRFIIDTEKSISELGLSNSSARLLPKYATVISARGTVGNYCLLSESMAFSQSNYGIKPKFTGCFFFTYLLVAFSVKDLQAASYGSVFDTITTSTFKEHKIKVPLEQDVNEIENKVKPYFLKMLSNTQQIRTLTNLRDTLLPKLMSGEVRVSETSNQA